jgi:hypothetical protein
MSIRFSTTTRQLAVASGLALMAASSAFAQQSSSATASASATVITPIAISKTADMVFGKIAVGGAGTVVLTYGGAVSVGSGNITIPTSNVTAPAAAAFSVTGENGFTYAIHLPGSAITLSDGAGNNMTVDTFTSSLGATSTSTGAGGQALTVGATLNVNAGQVPGAYTGSFSVSVDYN